MHPYRAGLFLIASWLGAVALPAAAMAAKAAAAAPNLLANPGFEVEDNNTAGVPDGWIYFYSHTKASEVTPAAASTGTNGLKLAVQQVPGAHQGVAQKVPVTPGAVCVFTVQIRNNAEDPLGKSTYGLLGIEWRDKDNHEISRVLGKKWGSTLSKSKWEQYEVSGKAPRDAATATGVIYLYDGERGAAGSFFADDARLEIKP